MVSILTPDSYGVTATPRQNFSPLFEVLKQVFGASEWNDDQPPTEIRLVVIVPPACSKTWFRHMLRHLECAPSTTPLYLVCEITEAPRNDTHAGLLHHLNDSGHVYEVSLSEKNALAVLRKAMASARSAQESLFKVLERAFPGGIEGLIEISLRPVEKEEHDLIAYAKKKRLDFPPALSLAHGACLAGDLPEKAFFSLSSACESADQRKLAGISQKAAEKRAKLRIDRRYTAPLFEYLEGRRIVIVEDQLEADHWAKLLPALFGANWASEHPLPCQCRDHQQGGITWSHYETLADLIADSKRLEKCDLLLLDLASSKGEHPDGIVYPMLRKGFVALAAELARIRTKCDPEANPSRPKSDLPETVTKSTTRIRTPPPIVIAFTATQNGITTRTLLQDVSINDFVFKTAGGPVHQRLHYYTLRQAIVVGLERRAAWIAHSEPARFRAWMLQFSPAERPRLMRMMERYQHYTINSLIGICRDALLDTKNPFFRSADQPHILAYLGNANKSGAASLALFAKARDIAGISTFRRADVTKTSYDFIASATDPIKDHVVFIDDFIGSGGQITRMVRGLEERLSGKKFSEPPLIWFMVGLDTATLRELATGRADVAIQPGVWHKTRISNTDAFIRIEEVAPPLDLSDEDEKMLKSHCLITRGRAWEVPCEFEPIGWKKNRGLVSLCGNVPGNTLPIIWAHGHINPWLPLKERFFSPFAKQPPTRETELPCLQPGGACPLESTLPPSTAPDPMAYALLGCNIALKKSRELK